MKAVLRRVDAVLRRVPIWLGALALAGGTLSFGLSMQSGDFATTLMSATALVLGDRVLELRLSSHYTRRRAFGGVILALVLIPDVWNDGYVVGRWGAFAVALLVLSIIDTARHLGPRRPALSAPADKPGTGGDSIAPRTDAVGVDPNGSFGYYATPALLEVLRRIDAAVARRRRNKASDPGSENENQRPV